MKFYSGFSLQNDKHFFTKYIHNSQYTVSGFSYGAIKALKYTQEQLLLGNRIDTLQLFSPAFFQTKSEKFKRVQTISFNKNSEQYLNSFIKLCFLPYQVKNIEYKEATILDLNNLLSYEWLLKELFEIKEKGIKIEVYLGGQDKIIDIDGAKKLFLEVATVTYIKDANHFLQTT